MFYRFLADLVLLTHALFILFVVFGGVLSLWKRWVAWLHLPALTWGALVVGMGWICPLTPLENRLRILAGEHAFDGSFIEHYVLTLIYPQGLTRDIQVLLAGLLVLGNLAVYAMWFRRRAH